jgi:hypothetical protein
MDDYTKIAIIIILALIVGLLVRIEQVNRLHFRQNSLDRQHELETNLMIIDGVKELIMKQFKCRNAYTRETGHIIRCIHTGGNPCLYTGRNQTSCKHWKNVSKEGRAMLKNYLKSF